MYLNVATEPVAVSRRSLITSEYTPDVCVDDAVVKFRADKFVYAISVMFASTEFVATGNVLVSATVNWSELRLCVLFAIAATNA